MSSTERDVNSDYVQMLNKIEKAGGITKLMKKCYPKFEVVRSPKGARIMGTLSIGDLDDDLKEFMINSYRHKKNINHEQIITGDRTGSTIVYMREVSENYLSNRELRESARKHAGHLFFEPLSESKENLINHVKGTGFPGGPFTPAVNGSEIDKRQDNPSIIQRFVNKFKEYSPGLG